MVTHKIKLKDIICLHNIKITGYKGHPVHVIVFLDELNNQTYIWSTSTAGLSYEVGEVYSISALCSDEYQLSYVKDIKNISDEEHAKSEQKGSINPNPDMFDKIFDT